MSVAKYPAVRVYDDWATATLFASTTEIADVLDAVVIVPDTDVKLVQPRISPKLYGIKMIGLNVCAAAGALLVVCVYPRAVWAAAVGTLKVFNWILYLASFTISSAKYTFCPAAFTA